jgi:hypothetical protein
MTISLLVTILVEGIIAAGYARWRGKPLRPILLTSIIANIITQFLLWGGLILFFHHYLSTLYFAEILIWMLESILLHRVRANQLELPEATLLSLVMNLASFGAVWFLPA